MTDIVDRLNAEARKHHQPELRPMRPKDAATLIIIDRSNGAPRVLMGRRHMRHKFMPGMFVFPGGRIDPDDWRTPRADDYHPAVLEKLMVAMKNGTSEARARAFGLAAIRETYEEAGLLIGVPANHAEEAPKHPDWHAFFERGIVPALKDFRFIARAITPPGRTRRFDTRFFAVDHSTIADRLAEGTGPSGELEDIAWPTLEDAKQLKLPIITLTILDELGRRLSEGSLDDPTAPAPFYSSSHGRFSRVLI